MNDNEILIIAWWISLFTLVTAKSTSWSTVLFRPSHFLSLFEFKSSSCCQTTSLGAIHYFALPIRIFHFSREFATPVCQEKCYSATTSSSLSSVQRVANLRLPWGVEAFYKTKKGPEDHCLCNPRHHALNRGKPSRFPTNFVVSVEKAGKMRWEGRCPRCPRCRCWPQQCSRGRGCVPVAADALGWSAPSHVRSLPSGGVGGLESLQARLSHGDFSITEVKTHCSF